MNSSERKTHYGRFWLPTAPTETVAGKLTIDPLKRVELEALDPSFAMLTGEDNGVTMLPSRSSVPLLHGETDAGQVSLLHSEFAGLSIGVAHTQSVRASIALQGIHLSRPEAKVFRRCQVRLPSLQGLLGEYPVVIDRSEFDSNSWVKSVFRTSLHEWDDERTSVTFEYVDKVTMNTISAKVAAVPLLTLSSAHPRSAGDWFGSWVRPLNELSSLLTGHKANPLSVELFLERRPPREVGRRSVELFAQGVGFNEYAGKDYQVMASASDIDPSPDGIHRVLDRFGKLETKHGVFLELLSGAIRHPDRPASNLYLDIMAALEAFDTQEHGKAPKPDAASKARSAKIIEQAREGGVGGKNLKHLRGRLAERSSYSLQDRLERLGAATGRDARWKVKAVKMAKIRNDIAHGNARFDPYLATSYEQAVDLARAVVLDQLGIAEPNT